MVARDCYVDNAAGRNGRGKKNGWKFDLMLQISRIDVLGGKGVAALKLRLKLRIRGKRTNLLSSVRRTATPASTLPTVREMSILNLDD